MIPVIRRAWVTGAAEVARLAEVSVVVTDVVEDKSNMELSVANDKAGTSLGPTMRPGAEAEMGGEEGSRAVVRIVASGLKVGGLGGKEEGRLMVRKEKGERSEEVQEEVESHRVRIRKERRRTMKYEKG